MEYTFRIKLGSKVSLVVCPINDFTGEIADINDINVFLPGLPVKPARKPEGYFVFCDLSGDEYRVIVDSEIYFTEQITVPAQQLESSGHLVYVLLKPGPSYPFPAGNTLIRFSVRNAHHHPLSGADVKVTVLSEGCARAKLGKDGAHKDTNQISVVNLTGKIAIGDLYSINRQGSPNFEYCKVVLKDGLSKQLIIQDPLLFDHQRGEPLLPVIKTRTDGRGEGVIYFRHFPEKQLDVKIEINYHDRAVSREITLEEGNVISLGKIEI